MELNVGDPFYVPIQITSNYNYSTHITAKTSVYNQDLQFYFDKPITLTGSKTENFAPFETKTIMVGPFMVPYDIIPGQGHYELISEIFDSTGNLLDVIRNPIRFAMLGDVNKDGIINILDLATVGSAFRSEEGNPTYIRNADINSDRIIDVMDLAIVGVNYGNEIGGYVKIKDTIFPISASYRDGVNMQFNFINIRNDDTMWYKYTDNRGKMHSETKFLERLHSTGWAWAFPMPNHSVQFTVQCGHFIDTKQIVDDTLQGTVNLV